MSTDEPRTEPPLKDQAGTGQSDPDIDLTPDKLAELWRYFEGIGNNARNQMISTAGWFLVIATGILSYVGKLALSRQPSPPDSYWSAYVAGVLGVVVCI